MMLKGEHLFVTGGAAGIGEAIILGAVKEGAKISFVDIDDAKANALVDKLSKEGYFKYCKKCHLKKTTLRQNKIVENKNENLFFLKGEFFSEHLETGLLVSNLGRFNISLIL